MGISTESEEAVRVRVDSLKSLCVQVFQKMGMSAEDARITADVLVTADLRGVDSHGVARLGFYVERLRNGVMVPRPDVRVVSETDCQISGWVARRRATTVLLPTPEGPDSTVSRDRRPAADVESWLTRTWEPRPGRPVHRTRDAELPPGWHRVHARVDSLRSRSCPSTGAPGPCRHLAWTPGERKPSSFR